MKKKITVIVLAVLLVLAIGYGVIATIAARSFADENLELLVKNTTLSTQYSSQMQANDPPATLKAVGNIISGVATTHKISDDTVLIIVPDTDSIVDKVKEYAGTIPVALKTAEYETCIIMAVDENDDCQFGWTIHADGSSKAFIGE